MKTQHDGDCTIYSTLINGNPESGVCTCGYGLERLRMGNGSEMYSSELVAKLSGDIKEYRQLRLNLEGVL